MTSPPEIDSRIFKKLLRDKQAQFQGFADTGAEAAATVELDQTRVGRLSRMDAMQSQAMSQAAQRRREFELQRITAALRRIDAGDYGRCLHCDGPVAPARLEVDPAATLCIQCAEKTGE